LPNGKRMVSQVDGGNGHSGKRSPGLHFGLGAAVGPVRVEVHWRDPDGQPNKETLTLKPGSHTVVLGWRAKGGSR
jgi:enediyne biosynthesis protein E4